MSRDDVTQALQEADERIERLRAKMAAAPDAPLPAGEWRVRDALSHIAARANPMPALERLRGMARAGSPPPAFDIHEINAGQVRDRAAMSVNALVDEMVQGHQTAREELAKLDDAALARTFTIPAIGREVTGADFLVLAGPRHEGNHLAEIEAALQ